MGHDGDGDRTASGAPLAFGTDRPGRRTGPESGAGSG